VEAALLERQQVFLTEVKTVKKVFLLLLVDISTLSQLEGRHCIIVLAGQIFVY
jgi:hypothetical protein